MASGRPRVSHLASSLEANPARERPTPRHAQFRFYSQRADLTPRPTT